MRCVVCGRLPSEGCVTRTHEVHDRLWNEGPVWVLDGSKRVVPSLQQREKHNG